MDEVGRLQQLATKRLGELLSEPVPYTAEWMEIVRAALMQAVQDSGVLVLPDERLGNIVLRFERFVNIPEPSAADKASRVLPDVSFGTRLTPESEREWRAYAPIYAWELWAHGGVFE